MDTRDATTSTLSLPWQTSITWRAVWPKVHKYILPGMVRQSWFLVLHRRAPIPHLPSWKPGPCLMMCGCQNCDSDHIYIDCKHIHILWLEVAKMLADLTGLLSEDVKANIQMAPPSEFALSFLSIGKRLGRYSKIRLWVWFTICLHSLMTAIYGLAKKESFDHMPRSLKPKPFANHCIRDIIHFITLLCHGPRHLSEEKFEAAWVVQNRLFSLIRGWIRLNHRAIREDDHSDAFDGGVDEEGWETVVDDSVMTHSATPSQLWCKAELTGQKRKPRMCRCCNQQVCTLCFEPAMGVQPEDHGIVIPAPHRRRSACDNCGGQPTRTQWWEQGSKPCYCGGG